MCSYFPNPLRPFDYPYEPKAGSLANSNCLRLDSCALLYSQDMCGTGIQNGSRQTFSKLKILISERAEDMEFMLVLGCFVDELRVGIDGMAWHGRPKEGSTESLKHTVFCSTLWMPAGEWAEDSGVRGFFYIENAY